MSAVGKRITHVARATEEARLVSMEDRLLSAKSVRGLLDCGDRTLRRWIGSGRFPKADIRIGRNLRWRESTVRQFIEDNEHE